MPIQLSDRSQCLKPSATLALNSKASELRSQGVDVINLSAGEPDFDTPEPIKQACTNAMQDGHTKYSPVNGIAPLREAISARLQRDCQLSYSADEIIVSNGAKHSLYNVAQAILNDGDEAIIPAPYWVSYPSMVSLAGGECVFVETDIASQFKLTAAQLEQAITPKTRLLFLNSPSNPTGMVYSAQELKALADVLIKHPNIAIISDDIYDKLHWNDGAVPHILTVCPELRDQVIVVNGLSKTYAMTGWRLGYTAAPSAITGAMKKIQSHSTSGPNTMAQHAGIIALQMTQAELAPMLDAYQSRLHLAHELLTKIPGIDCLLPQGAFYLYPHIAGAMQAAGITEDTAAAEALLIQHNVAAVPGSAFGTNGYLRISCACSEENLRAGIERIAEWAGA